MHDNIGMDTLIVTCSMTSCSFPHKILILVEKEFYWPRNSEWTKEDKKSGGRKRNSSEKNIFDLFPWGEKRERRRKEKANPFGCLLGALFFSLVRDLFGAVLSCCVLENDF